MKYNLIYFLFLVSIPLVQSQNLKRKGSLGVAYYPSTPDTLAQRLHYTEGVVVKQALPNSTAAALGLLKDDIIIQINDDIITQPLQLPLIAKKMREGEVITVNLLRHNKRIGLKGKVIGKPRETSPFANVIYGEFQYKNGYVRTIYKTLKNKKPLATIYFLQGLPCYSMDNFQEADITKRAIDAMVERGFAVYRIEKGDLGDNSNQPPCEQMGFMDELAMYEAGYNHLLSLSEVDSANVFLFGHSMGGITAPLLAEKFQPKGVVVYGTGFKPWQEYLFDAFLIQSQYWGDDLAELRSVLETYKPFIYEYFYNNKPFDEIIANPLGLKAFQEILGYDIKTGLVASGRSVKTFKELNEQPLARAWGNYKNDVLAMYGECDIAAIHPDDHITLIDYVNKKHPGKGTFKLIPKTTHTFEEIGTMEEFIKWQYKPVEFQQYAASHFNSSLFDESCNWMKSLLQKK